MTYTKHYSVLYRECLDALIGSARGEKPHIADLTFGGGGAYTRYCKRDP
jgi:16S rRNA C1402 N4-methylase RsmH